MRELKFRFWDSKEKIMYENTSGLAIGSTGEVSQLIYHDGGPNYDCVEWEGTEYSKHIIPLQYTGLKDKNSKEVFESDKLKAGDFVYIVKWYEKSGAWFCEPIQQEYRITTTKLLYEILENWGGVVIGNIYENPELLKVTKDCKYQDSLRVCTRNNRQCSFIKGESNGMCCSGYEQA